MSSLGRVLVSLGLALVVVGGLLWALGALGIKLPLGRLPGDIHVERDGWSFHLPLATSLLLSLVLSLLLSLLWRR